VAGLRDAWTRFVLPCAAARAEGAIALAASIALFAWASAPAARWLVDDAAISYVYGMNLGQDGQLAPNLEGTAVEGFSNPLTVAVVAILSAAHAFHPLTTHRTIDAIVFGLAGWIAFRLLRDVASMKWVAWLGLVIFLGLEVCTPATMIWYGSGLENGQLTLGILALLWRLRAVTTAGFSPAIDAALLAAVALTRPEAPLFSLVWVVVAGILASEPPLAATRRSQFRGLLATAAITLLLLTIGAIARYALFACLLPNTYYAKVGGVDLRRNYLEYVRPLLGNYWCAFGFSGCVVALHATAHLRRLALALVSFSGAALALPLLAGGDWMGHHRFATAFLMLGHFSFAAACCAAWTERRRPSTIMAIARVVPAAAALFLFASGRDEYRQFVHGQYVGFAMIADVEGFERVRLQRYLGMIYPVVALPDAGGSLAVGGMQLVDTASLVDYQMARVRSNPELVRRYQHDERQIDLAEYHAWLFDQGLVGSKFLAAAKFSMEQDYPNFVPAYAVRRDLVEVNRPDAGSIRLGANGEIEAFLSGRTVLVGAPGALLRVELLISPRDARWDSECRVRVAIADETEERTVFTLSPISETVIEPTPGRYYRHGFLLRLPSSTGDYPLSVRLCSGSSEVLFTAPRPVLVRSAAGLSLAEARDHGSASQRDLLDEARRVAQLREQLIPRVPLAERVALLTRLRASYRDGSRTDVAAYDALVRDSRPPFVDPAPASVGALVEEILSVAGSVSARLWADRSFGVGARTLAVGRLVDALRRLGYLGVAGSEAMAPVMAAALSEREPPSDPSDSYARALGLALLLPGKASHQKRLAEARSTGASLPQVDAWTGEDDGGHSQSPSAWRRPLGG